MRELSGGAQLETSSPAISVDRAFSSNWIAPSGLSIGILGQRYVLFLFWFYQQSVIGTGGRTIRGATQP